MWVTFGHLAPAARRPPSGKPPVFTGTNQVGAHTGQSRHGWDASLIPCASQVTPTRDRRSMPYPARTGATFRCSRHAHAAASVMPERLDAPRAVHAPERRAAPSSALGRAYCPSGDDGVGCLFQRTGLGRRPRRFLPGLLQLGPEFLQLFTAEAGPHLGKPDLFFFLDVMGDVLDQHRGLGIEALRPGRACRPAPYTRHRPRDVLRKTPARRP